MKKLLFFIILLIGLFSVPTASAAVIGEVLSTDIGSLIDDQPIESYNINDYTYVIAEDLRAYGFDVIWDGDARTLSIYHDVHKGYEITLDKQKINIKKSDIPQRQHRFDVFSTDIKTYLDGKQITAYNIDGQTLIQIDELAQYGEFYYDDTKRLVDLRIMKPSFEYGLKILDDRQDTTLTINPPRYAQQVEYSGNLSPEGKADGIGKVTYLSPANSIAYAYWNMDGSLLSAKDNHYREDYMVYDGTISRSYSCGETNTTIYGRGSDAYTMPCESRYEYSEKYSRNGLYDNSYLYGFYITDETYYDNDKMAINYTNGSPAKFTEIMSDNRFTQINYVKTTDGLIFASGYDGANDTGWDSTGANSHFKVFTKTNLSAFPAPPTSPAVENVVSYSAADEAAYNRIISLTDNGDVYFERTPGVFASVRDEQSDHLDLSAPVKVFENAKYVNIQLKDVAVVTGCAYIPYFYVVDNNNDLWFWNYEYLNQSQTGNEYDENNGYIAYGQVPYIKKPVKICENVKKAFGTETKYVLKTDGTVWVSDGKTSRQILDNVVDMSADHLGLNFMALKNDGSLWVWGNNQNGQCGLGHTDIVCIPIRVTTVYESMQ